MPKRTRDDWVTLIKNHPNGGKVSLRGIWRRRVDELEALYEKVQNAHELFCVELARRQEAEQHRLKINELFGEPVWEDKAALGPGTRMFRDFLWCMANAYMPMVYEIEKLRLIRMAYDHWKEIATAAETGMHDGLVTEEDAAEAFDLMCGHIRRVHLDRTVLPEPDLGERTHMIALLTDMGYEVTKKRKD